MKLRCSVSGQGAHQKQTLPIGVQVNPRPGTTLSQRNVPASFSIVATLFALRFAALGDLFVPNTNLQLGKWAFCEFGPIARYSLPPDIWSAYTLSTFKNMLKTHFLLPFYFTD